MCVCVCVCVCVSCVCVCVCVCVLCVCVCVCACVYTLQANPGCKNSTFLEKEEVEEQEQEEGLEKKVFESVLKKTEKLCWVRQGAGV